VLGILRRLLLRLFPDQRQAEDFIRRIEAGDVEYIIKVGVPSVEAPPTPGPRPLRNRPYVAEGLDIASILIVDPDSLLYILSASSGLRTLRLSGQGSAVLAELARASRDYETPVYGFSLLDRGEVRFLAYRGLITGLYYEVAGRGYTGLEALERFEAEKVDGGSFHLSSVRERIVEWSTEKLSVYVPGLDRQHMYLINTLNSLYAATVAGEGYKVLKDILRRLVEYSRFHFKSEEILMEKFGYPEDRLARHRSEHEGFARAASSFRERYEAGEAALTVDVFKFLARWVESHIERTDRDYGEYFKKKGILEAVR